MMSVCNFGVRLLVYMSLYSLHAMAWPRKVSSRVEGDIMLGGLMMVHERENETLICGDIMIQGGVQALEAMLFTIDYVNRENIMHGLSMGTQILDDCDKDTYGLQQSVNFIKGRFDTLDGADMVCKYRNNSEAVNQHTLITGVVAAASSVTSIQVANLLKLFDVPQVSFFSTSPELSNLERFPYFFRTIPSDDYQVEAMKDILINFGWTYVSVIYEESSYGKMAFNRLESILKDLHICMAVKAQLPKDSDVARVEKYRSIVTQLIQKVNARGVIIYGSDQEVRQVMIAVNELNATGMFTWIGSDGWSARQLVYQPTSSDGRSFEAQVLGTISVQPEAHPIKGFQDYFQALKVHTNTRNPWFYELWEKEFNCRFQGYPDTPYNYKLSLLKNCTGNEHKLYEFEKQLQFVSDAVLVFAYAIRDLLEARCGNPIANDRCVKCHSEVYRRLHPGYCHSSIQVDGKSLREYIKRVQFPNLCGGSFQFLNNTNGPPPDYNIIHFREDTRFEANTWQIIGNYTKHGLHIDESELRFYTKGSHGTVPISICSAACDKGKVKKYVNDDRCCWLCDPCLSHQFVNASINECNDCPLGQWPSDSANSCEIQPMQKVELISIYGIPCALLAAVGTIINTVILVVFIQHNDTPVVRASSRELSYVILIGLYLCFSVTPLTLSIPSTIVCGAQRATAGFAFTVVYAAILTKTNRISRIFQSGKRTARRPHLISPSSQLVICSAICSFHVVLILLWMYAFPAQALIEHPTHKENQLVCAESVEIRYFYTYAYPVFLCIVCTIYAYRTRKMPEAFNESKYIGIAVYTTCVVWLAFIPVYSVSRNETSLRTVSVCVSSSLTAFVIQALLFLPKLYIILIRPEKNKRTGLMLPRTSCVVSADIDKIKYTQANQVTHNKTKSEDSDNPSEELFSLPLTRKRNASEGSSVGTQTQILSPTSDPLLDPCSRATPSPLNSGTPPQRRNSCQGIIPCPVTNEDDVQL